MKDKEKLEAILTYHVVPGKLKAADVVKLTEVIIVNEKQSVLPLMVIMSWSTMQMLLLLILKHQTDSSM